MLKPNPCIYTEQEIFRSPLWKISKCSLLQYFDNALIDGGTERAFPRDAIEGNELNLKYWLKQLKDGNIH